MKPGGWTMARPLPPQAGCRICLVLALAGMEFVMAADTHASSAGRPATAVLLDLGPPGSDAPPGWRNWSIPAGDENGPLTLDVPPSPLAPDGFRITLGPGKGLGCRSGPACEGPLAAMIRESAFCHAGNPMSLHVAGLQPGLYRLRLWLNDARGYVWPPVRVTASAAGAEERVLARDHPQTAVTQTRNARPADLQVPVGDSGDVLLLLTIPPLPKTYVFLSGIEIHGPDALHAAILPDPPDGALVATDTLVASWHAAPDTRNWRVLAGPSPDTLEPVGETLEQPQLPFRGLEAGKNVFWRVDSTTDDGTLHPGRLWRFAVAAAVPYSPAPPHGAVDIPLGTTLSWRCDREDVRFDLRLGPSPDRLAPLATGLRRGCWSETPAAAGSHYWQVVAHHGKGSVEGPLWHFVSVPVVVIDDFEHGSDLALRAAWDDGRAADPRRGPVVRIEGDAPRVLALDWPGGVCRVRRDRRSDESWPAATMTDLVLDLCPKRPETMRALRVRLEDADGAGAEADLTPTADSWTPGRWTEVRIPLQGYGGVALDRLEHLTIEAVAKGPCELLVDDVRLLGREPPGAPPQPAPLTEGTIADIPGVPPLPSEDARRRPSPVRLRTDVCVVGGGSGGIGAALAAARQGVEVILLEREAILGGTSTAGGIANWEPGPGCSIAAEIVARLQRCPGAVMMNRPRYEDTLTRAGGGTVQFEPGAFHTVVRNLLEETGHCRVLLNTTFTQVSVNQADRRVGRVTAIRDDGTRVVIQARTFLDCTGGAFLCQAAGCEVMLGAEPKQRFGEDGAPEQHLDRLNAIELVYRIRPSHAPRRQELPPGLRPRRGGAAWPQPSGDRFVNTCGGLAPGWLLVEKGYGEARRELETRALAHWHWLQQEKYPDYEFDGFAPMLAIRESHRIVGEYVLTQQDLEAGILRQPHQDVIALADHPMDTHGQGGGLGNVAAPYGIPFRCLVPRGGWRNLLIACRGAGFSHIAASSCRLSRTMMALGHAAGLAAAQCSHRGCDVPEVDVSAIQDQLGLNPSARDRKAPGDPPGRR
ncbi:MAG: FAD-dependent oxidoreductase [Lentisphaeria bacterium]|nr:FAD-dependent oxidoreductase [Lentisphaeria bacterium]